MQVYDQTCSWNSKIQRALLKSQTYAVHPFGGWPAREEEGGVRVVAVESVCNNHECALFVCMRVYWCVCVKQR